MEHKFQTINKWFEALPDSCPEEGACPPNGKYYRITDSNVIKCEDFWSHRKKSPTSVYQTTECRALSISVFKELSDCKEILKTPRNKGKVITVINLNSDAGLIKKTGKSNSSHHSWWRKSTFDVIKHCEKV